MKGVKFLALAALLLLASVHCQDMTVTLTQGDVAAIPLSSLFPAASENKLKKLGQAPVPFNVSHPAATIHSFDMVNTTFQGLLPAGATEVDAYLFRSSANKLVLIANGVYTTYIYSPTERTFTQDAQATLKDQAKCTGLDLTSSIVVVGCMGDDGISADLYAIVDDVPLAAVNVPFEQDRMITNRLRVEVASDSSLLAFYDDMYVQGQGDTNKPAIYFAAIDQQGAITYYNSIVTVGSSDMLKVTEANLNSGDQGLELIVSFIDSNSANFEVNRCDVTVDAQTPEVTIANCADQGINDLAIKAGAVRYFPSSTSPSVIAYDNTVSASPKVTRCFFDPDTQKFSDCLSTINSLPFGSGANVVCTSITLFKGTLALNFQNTQDNRRWALTNFANFQATGTMALGFDPINEVGMKVCLVLAPKDAIAVFQNTLTLYGTLDQSLWKVMINAKDIPASANSNVALGRALITITKNPTSTPQQKLVRVMILDKMNSWMGFADQLPDFGGITGGNGYVNFDRTWVYGNNLDFQFTGSALVDTKVYDRIDFPITFTPNPGNDWEQFYVVGPSLIVGAQDGNIYLYNCQEKIESSSCSLNQNFAIPAGYTTVAAESTTYFPDTIQTTSILVWMINQEGNIQVLYIWLADTSESKFVQVGTVDDTFRHFHTINYEDTILLLTAPTTSEDQANVVVYTIQNTLEGFTTFQKLTTLDPTFMGVPANAAPTALHSCGHNAYVFEFLSGNGFLIKVNVNGVTAEDFVLRSTVRITNPTVPAFVATDFCPMGDEFLIWDNSQNFFTTSTTSDDSIYNFHLDEFGFASVTRFSCARDSSAVGIWGTDSEGNTLLATIYGNQFYRAHSRIHSVVQWPSAVSYTATYSYHKSAILHVGLDATGALTTKKAILSGPIIQTSYAATFTDPNWTMKITSGDQSRTVVQQVNMQKVNTNVVVNAKAKRDITAGSWNLEEQAQVIGHIDEVAINIPDSLKGIISLQQRYNKVPDSLNNQLKKGSVSNAITFLYVLDSTSSCTLYVGYDPATFIAYLSTRGDCESQDVSLGRSIVTNIDGVVGSNQAVASILYKVGGNAYVTTYFMKFDGTNTQATANLHDGNPHQIKIARAEEGVFSIFVNYPMYSMCQVYKLTQSTGEYTSWDSIANCINVYPVNSMQGAMAFVTYYRDTNPRFYSVLTSQSKGNIQTIQMDGSNYEFLDIQCAGVDSTIQCGMLTYGANIVYFTANIQANLTINDGDWNTRSLFNFAEPGESGTYFNLAVTRDWIVAQNIEGHLDVFSTQADKQGYMFTRIPASATSAKKLKDDPIHELPPRGFCVNWGGATNPMPIVTRLTGSQGNDQDQIGQYQIQNLTLVVTDQISEANADDVNSVNIVLGNGASPASFSIEDFFEPKKKPEPKPEPPAPEDEKSLTWLWILLVVVGVVALIGVGAYVYMQKNKEGGAEDGAYEKNEPFVEQPAKKRDSDEFN